jgi:hypothetical protein
MRNPKPTAKISRLYDYASTNISNARRYSAGSIEGSREVRRPQITTIPLPKVRGSPRRSRHGEALAALSDATHWLLGTLCEWQWRCCERHQLAGWICPNERVGNLSESPFDCPGVAEQRAASSLWGEKRV